MKKIIYLLFMLVLSAQAAWAQSNWEFVGPKSTNQSPDNKFETGQFNNITVDPNDPQHLFASSWFGGLWESTDRGSTWDPVDISQMNCNGVSAVYFLNATEILVGDIYQESRYGSNKDPFRFYSKAAWKYNFSSNAWTPLGTLNNPSATIPFRIKSIAVYPGNTSILFVCTTQGLYRSTNGGGAWTRIVNDCVENMVFVPYSSNPVKYYCYIAGSNGVGGKDGNNLIPLGKVMVKESSNADAAVPSFTDLSSNFSTPKSVSHAKICIGPKVSNEVRLFLSILASNNLSFGGVEATYIHTFKKNVVTNSLSGYANIGTNNQTEDRDLRLAIAYDAVNNAVWFGGVRLNYLHVPTSSLTTSVLQNFHTSGGEIHDDMHDIQIQSYNGQVEMYVAHDAGIARSIIGQFSNNTPPSSPDNTKLYFNPLNNKLDVCLLTGFSGTDNDKDLYAIGAHDIINADIYDAVLGKNRYTHETWENDGAWIDKFDKDKMFFDANQYNALYHVSSNGGQTIGSSEQFYRPAPGNVFAQGTIESITGGGGFMPRQFYQDPYRSGRIFHAKSHIGISQFDPVSKTFVYKIEPWMIQPNLDWTCYSGAWNIQSWSIVKGMSFSPQTPNSLHILLNGDPFSGSAPCLALPNIVKYIGPNLDDCWNGHNLATYTDGSGSHPQWAKITPTWANFGITDINDIVGINFIEIATSPWNKDVVYVMLTVPHHPEIHVLKYDGNTWSNYSQGLPAEELGYSMMLDYQSNDGIYLSTNMHVYYRDANPVSQWQIYKAGIPFVPASQIEVNYTDNTVRAGTYGRGIWKTGLECPALSTMNFSNQSIIPAFIQAMSITTTNVTIQPGKTILRAANSITLNPNFIADGSTGAVFLGYIHGCSSPGNSLLINKDKAMQSLLNDVKEREESEENNIRVYPNPNTGSFSIAVDDDVIKDVFIYDVMGKLVFSKKETKDRNIQVDISSLKRGVYLIKIRSDKAYQVKKVLVE